jgi:hypothetical protein
VKVPRCGNCRHQTGKARIGGRTYAECRHPEIVHWGQKIEYKGVLNWCPNHEFEQMEKEDHGQ